MTIQEDYYAETLGFPRGLLFRPSEPLIIEYYLLNKVRRLPDYSGDTIIDSDDVYGDFMEVINFFRKRQMECLYFYTKLKNKNKNGNQIDRTNNYGTWKSQNDSQIFSDPPNQKHIGSKRSFSFLPKGVHDIGRWTMLEYRLDGQYRDTTNRHNYVICQIKMKEGIKGVVYQSNEQEYTNEEFWEDINAFMNLPSPADTTLSTMDPLCFTEHTTCYVETLGLPQGFQFSPSEPLMVEYYLLNKVRGIPDHSNGIVIESDDVYGNFSEMINFIQVIRRMNCLYFYTKLKKKNKNGNQIDRTNNCGTWKERRKEYINDSDRIHIGYKRSFSFVLGTGVDDIGRWTMLECGLDGKYADITNRDNYVICRITKHEGMRDPVNTTVADNFANDAEESYIPDPELQAHVESFQFN